MNVADTANKNTKMIGKLTVRISPAVLNVELRIVVTVDVAKPIVVNLSIFGSCMAVFDL